MSVLCNSEVIEVDQDPLGKQGRVVRRTPDEFVLAKPLEDGAAAVGLFNLSEAPRIMEIAWTDLGFEGACRVRDLWRQKDLRTPRARFSSTVPVHGVSMLRITPGGNRRRRPRTSPIPRGRSQRSVRGSARNCVTDKSARPASWSRQSHLNRRRCSPCAFPGRRERA